jgi:hypothetical protein
LPGDGAAPGQTLIAAFDLEGRRITAADVQENGPDRGRPTPHLFCPTGLLDDVWWHRSYWVYGAEWYSGAFGYFRAGRKMPSGQLLVFDETTVYGYGRKPQYYRWTTPMEYRMFAASKDAAPVAMENAGKRRMPETRFETDWTLDVPVLARAMALAGQTLLVAGPPDLVDENRAQRDFGNPEMQRALARQAAALEDSEGGLLCVISTEGEKLGEIELESVPVFDGMIAAAGRLYVTMHNGDILCLGRQP